MYSLSQAWNIWLAITAILVFTGLGPRAYGQEKSVDASRVVVHNAAYDICKVSYPAAHLKMFWKDGGNNKLRSLGNLRSHVQAGGRKLVFATNAGMYTTENAPKGLYVEDGKQLVPIDLKIRKSGSFNFYMQPNGVFLLTEHEAKVVQSRDYHSYAGKAVFATQSGPMLVVDGAINPAFAKGSANVNIRSGVGIDKNGKVVFAISEGLVNFYDFAALFRDTLGCRNVLFLDGAICRMYLPAIGRTDSDGDFGAMIGIAE